MSEGPGRRRRRALPDGARPAKLPPRTNAITGSVTPGGSSVVVTRHRHPFEGQTLAVLGRMRRHGVIELLVVLPDGSKTLLPAAWTDEGSCADAGGDAATGGLGPATLGSLGDLLAASTLISVLAVRAGAEGAQQAARRPPCKEDHRATCPAESDARGRAAASAGPGGVTARQPVRRRNRDARPPDRQGVRPVDRRRR